jgi:hypothetical protein
MTRKGGDDDSHGTARVGDHRDLQMARHPAELMAASPRTDGRVGAWQDPNVISLAVDCEFTRRAYLAGTRIACVPTVGVLKFPSPMWGAYSRTGSRRSVCSGKRSSAIPTALSSTS